jgi:HEAT repeat protein
VDILTEIPGRQATIALAQRAVFDLSADVRATAIRALRERPLRDSRDVFLRAMRYPWAPAADHAAEALAALGDQEAVPYLVAQLKQPDPTAPYCVGKYVVVQEVVRANHLNNCLLCHPPAFQGGEPCLGLDPVVTIPSTPALVSAAGTIARTFGSHGYGASTSLVPTRAPLLIRGDVTYLRQDFSVQQPVLQPLVPGQLQRFDYLVRTRLITAAEWKQASKVDHKDDYQQREAVLFALRSLTNKDAGKSTEAWRELYPRAELEVEAEKLTRELLQSSPDRREVVLKRLRDTKGLVHTVALANAIPSLKGAFQEKAREALIERMARMTPATLRDKFGDEDAEVRQAAILATVRKDDKQYVPDLIALFEESDPVISRTAQVGLTLLSGKELHSPQEWRDWWKKQTP